MRIPVVCRVAGVVLFSAVFLACVNASAHPYASGLTNRSGSIYFILNEDAGDVSIIYGNNAATNDLGALSQGLNSFSLTYQSVAYTNYSIVVSKLGAGAVTLDQRGRHRQQQHLRAARRGRQPQPRQPQFRPHLHLQRQQRHRHSRARPDHHAGHFHPQRRHFRRARPRRQWLARRHHSRLKHNLRALQTFRRPGRQCLHW